MVCLLETSLFTPSLTVWFETLKVNYVFLNLSPVHASYYIFSLITNQTSMHSRPIFTSLQPLKTAHSFVLFMAHYNSSEL